MNRDLRSYLTRNCPDLDDTQLDIAMASVVPAVAHYYQGRIAMLADAAPTTPDINRGYQAALTYVYELLADADRHPLLLGHRL